MDLTEEMHDPVPIHPDAAATLAAGRPMVPPDERSIDDLPPGQRVRFSGDGGEYFKIWATNLALTILTIGIYSAWAKVRRLRYFYGNTTLSGSTFDFHGRPAAILRGRIVALILLVLYTQSAKISIALFVGTVLAIAAIFPWLFYRSLCFRLGNTSYRGVRFHFGGTAAGAYAFFTPIILLVLAPNLLLVTLAEGGKPGYAQAFELVGLYLLILLVWPYFLHRLRTYQHGEAYFGRTRFSYGGTAGMFYGLIMKCAGLMFLAGIVVGVVGAAIAGVARTSGVHEPVSQQMAGVITILVAVPIYGFMLALIPYWTSRSQNIVWGNTALAGSRFRSELRFKPLFWIDTVNFFLTIFTLGIFRPFAAIRSARVRLEAVGFEGDVSVFEGAEEASSGAMGSEFVDLFGFDISL
jgi:uncharacterized membrane protein YjgN (DUF898 family)